MRSSSWIRSVLVAGGLLCGLAPVLTAQVPHEYREDTPSASGDFGIYGLYVRRAVGSGLCGSDGDRCYGQVDANGALHTVVTNASLAVTQSGSWSVSITGTPTFTMANIDVALSTRASESTLSTLNAKIPASPATDRTTAAAPFSTRLSDGSAFYKALTDTELRATPVPVSGTISLSGSVDTELPAAAALSDNFANPTAPAVGAFALVWDGSTWDRLPGTAADGALVNLGSNNDVTVTGSVTANAGTNLNTSALALESGGNLAATATSAALLDDAVSTTGSAVPAKGIQATGTDGTNARALKTDSGGELQVDVLTVPTVTVTDGSGAMTVDGSVSCSNCSGSGASDVDDSSFAVGTDSVAPAGALFDDSSPDSVDEGDDGILRMSANRNLYTTLRDAAGNERGVNVTAGNALTVDGSATTQPVSATNLDVRDLVAASDSVTVHGTEGAAQQADLTNSDPLLVAIVDGAGDQITSFGGGTQYTEGDTDATITGTAMLMEGAGNALVAAPGTAADGLLVNLGSNNDVVVSFPPGLAQLSEQQTQTTALQLIDDAVSTTGSAVPAKGLQATGTDGTNARALKTDTGGELQVDVLSSALPSGASTLGEQQAQTTNLADIEGFVDGLEGSVDGLEGFTDGIEGLLTTIDGDTGTIAGAVSGTEMQVDVVAALPAGNNNVGDVDVASLPNEGQQTAANSISVTPDTDNDAIGAAGAAPPGEYVAIAGVTSGATGGFLGGITVCDSHVSVDIVTATTVLAVTGVSGRHVRICAINLLTAGANNVAIVAGTGATCGTSTAGMNGGTTAAEGWNFAANGGIAQGSGLGEIMRTETTGDSVCIITSAAVQLSGSISYAIH